MKLHSPGNFSVLVHQFMSEYHISASHRFLFSNKKPGCFASCKTQKSSLGTGRQEIETETLRTIMKEGHRVQNLRKAKLAVFARGGLKRGLTFPFSLSDEGHENTGATEARSNVAACGCLCKRFDKRNLEPAAFLISIHIIRESPTLVAPASPRIKSPQRDPGTCQRLGLCEVVQKRSSCWTKANPENHVYR